MLDVFGIESEFKQAIRTTTQLPRHRFVLQSISRLDCLASTAALGNGSVQ